MRKLMTLMLAGAALSCMTAPALADVKSGVDAWARGDYSAAVSQWRGPADAGDPDAQFNMGQAYKLGRGVPSDIDRALDYFRRAAAQGHLRAEDNYGLLLFQQGRRADAMYYVQKSADRGEPRAQYILGTALFNGEFVTKDWVRAYALMSRAASSGLPQATTSLAQMDKFIPEGDRRKGQQLAQTLTGQDRQFADAAPSAPPSPPVYTPSPRPTPSSVRPTELPPSSPPPGAWRDTPPRGTTRSYIPAPGPEYTPSPDYPPAPDYTPPPSRPAPPPRAARPVPAATPAPAPKATPKPAPATGGWRVQLGAFGEDGRAQALWGSLKGRVSGLSALQPYLVKGGGVTRLQAGPLRSEADANRICGQVKATGQACIPKKM